MPENLSKEEDIKKLERWETSQKKRERKIKSE